MEVGTKAKTVENTSKINTKIAVIFANWHFLSNDFSLHFSKSILR